jgi:cyanate permease
MERRVVAWAGAVLVLVLLAYLVPYTLLSRVDAWYGSFLFWMVFGLVAIAAIWAMTRSWRD